MAPASPVDMRCEHLVDPVGVDAARPRFSWRVESARRGDRPTGWRILVASAAELAANRTGDFWDSGLIESGDDGLVEYQGEPLLSCARYFWRVMWRDGQGDLSPWSAAAVFTTGYLRAGEWKPRWISQRDIREFGSRGQVLLGETTGENLQALAVYLRKEFSLRGKPAMALAFISGLGTCELYLNGEKIGDRVLDPGWTDYRVKALYSTYDVTAMLQPKNAVGVILGNGRHVKSLGYGPPKLALRIEIEYDTGDRDVVASDESWATSHGPLQENGLYFGEKYDARLEMPGWDRPGFDESAWKRAVTVQGPPLASQMMPPIRVTETLAPRTAASPAPGVRVFDFGRNFSGWVRLKIQGPAGTEIRLRHAELLNEDGLLNTGSIENAEATDTYILKGGGPETFEPRFTYHGFRYVEISGCPGDLSADAVEGRFVHTDVEQTGTFACSDDLIGRIHDCVVMGQLSNLMSIPTDCPQRDERHGWLGDAHLSAEEALFNFDMAAFYTKFLEDIRLAVKEDGSLPDVAPAYLPRLYPADPAWGSAYATILWLAYEHYGDVRLLARHFPSVKKYLDFLGRNSEGHIIRSLGKYGDWCPPGSIVPKKTPVELTSTWYYLHDVRIAARIARVLGQTDAARTYESLAESIKAAFNGAYLEGDQYAAARMSRIDTYPNQTSNVLPLFLDMVPADKKAKVADSLLRSVVRNQDYHVDTGILGTCYLLDVLTRLGHAEAAFRVATRKSYPGWGYMIGAGATTLWERWEELTGSAMNSQNHIMFGSIDAWFYRTLAGVSILEPGWKKIQVKPLPLGGLTSASAVVKTIRGQVRAAWTKSESSFDLEVQVPVGASAVVHLPETLREGQITESGTRLWDKGTPTGERPPGVTSVTSESAQAVIGIESGAYRFEWKKES